eukprot:gene5635-6215_t
MASSTTIASPLISVGTNFWNLRGSFLLFNLVEIGTHMSFIKLPTGKFLVINTVDITPAAKSAIDSLTNNGQLIEAVLATHPFHTIYFPSFHRLYPNTRYYGCPRHLKKVSIPWTGSLVDPAILSSWEDQGVFLRVPDGTDILTPAEDNHLSCVFVFHRESRTIHIDDTIMYFEHSSCFLRCLGAHAGDMDFWAGGLKKGLKNTKEAPLEFKNFIQSVINDWDFDNVCTAHVGNMVGGAKALMQRTLEKATPALEKIARSRS